MNDINFTKACENYINFYNKFIYDEFKKTPQLNVGEEKLKYFIKKVIKKDQNSIKFEYIERKYYFKDFKVLHTDKKSTFTVKLTKENLDALGSTSFPYIFNNYLAIIAYIACPEITNEAYSSELVNYIYE